MHQSRRNFIVLFKVVLLMHTFKNCIYLVIFNDKIIVISHLWRELMLYWSKKGALHDFISEIFFFRKNYVPKTTIKFRLFESLSPSHRSLVVLSRWEYRVFEREVYVFKFFSHGPNLKSALSRANFGSQTVHYQHHIRLKFFAL